MFKHTARPSFTYGCFCLGRLIQRHPYEAGHLLERTGQPQHQGIHPLLFLNSACVGSLTPHRELTHIEDICETEPLQMKLQRQQFLLSYFKILRVDPAEVRTCGLSHDSPMLNQLSHRCNAMLFRCSVIHSWLND